MFRIGAQFFTLHEQAKTLEDFSESLKRVADIGYTTVQISGTCAYEADWLAEQLKATGLTCNLTHYNYQRIVGETEKVIAEHNAFGCDYIGVGSMPGIFTEGADLEQLFRDFLEKGKPAGQKMATEGKLFMYHNHDPEYRKFIDGKNVMECLSEAFAPNELGFTLDTYWAYAGGADPVSEIRRLSGRIPCVHFKDMVILPDGTKHFAPIGSGILDFEKISAALEDTGTKYAFVEQDDCYGEDPFVCLKRSYDYLRSIGLE